jgi:hypothetical protein
VSKKVFDPDWGNPSLRTIMETELPQAVSLIPSTPGWWILFLALVGLIIRVIWRKKQAYLRDCYRRDALVQLTRIKAQLNAGELEAVRELAPLLRATAIAAGGRDIFSGLQDEAYATALADLCPNHEPLPVKNLQQLAYAPLIDIKLVDVETLMTALESWIRKHRRNHA